jgi:hypothetical protein
LQARDRGRDAGGLHIDGVDAAVGHHIGATRVRVFFFARLRTGGIGAVIMSVGRHIGDGVTRMPKDVGPRQRTSEKKYHDNS